MSTELFLVGSLVITTVGTLLGYVIGRTEAKGEYIKINNRNLRAMNELENEVEDLASKLNLVTVSPEAQVPAASDMDFIDPEKIVYEDYASWHEDNISDPLPPKTPSSKKAKAPSETKKQTPKRKKGKK